MSNRYHGKTSVIKLDTAAAGGVQDISAAFNDGSGDRDVDRPNMPVFGDLAQRKPVLGLEDNKYQFSGYWRDSTGLKVHGKNTRLYMQQYAVYSYLNSGKIGRKVKYPSCPVFGDAAKRYPIAGLMTGEFSAGGYTDYSASQINSIMRTAKLIDPSAGTTTPFWTLGQNGTTIGAYADMFQALPEKFGTKTGEEKPVTLDLSFGIDDQVDLGVFLHAEGAETATGDYASVDEAAATSRGAVAHLHVLAFTGTNATIKIQHATDNSTWVDLITFTVVTGITSQRATLAAGTTINRYVRAQISAVTALTTITPVIAFARRGFTYVTTAGNHRHFCGLMGGSVNGTLTSATPLGVTAFEFHPIGTTAGNPKETSNVRISDYSVDFGEEKPTMMSVSMPVDGQITDGTN